MKRKIRGYYKFGRVDLQGDIIPKETIEKMELKNTYPLTLVFKEPIGEVTVTKDMENNQLVIEGKIDEKYLKPKFKGIGIGGQNNGQVIHRKKDLRSLCINFLTDIELFEISIVKHPVDEDNVWDFDE